MKTTPFNRRMASGASKQRGVVLFFALVALVAMSLAAVALIRSVDTSTLIAGNLAFKQSATSAGDAGIESAIAWLDTTSANNGGKSVLGDPTHHFNITNLAARPGYHSNIDPNLDLFAATTWNSSDNNNVLAGTDTATGNEIRFVIQRMCRLANQPAQDAECLFGGEYDPKGKESIKSYSEVCVGDGCYIPGQSPLIRITARASGPRNSVSYVQAFVY
jgi:Tfp pilus assembly protein PilX